MRPLSRVWMVALITVTTAACIKDGARLELSPVVTPAGVRFRLVDGDARSVAVAGSFNGWSASSHQLAREGTSNVWTLAVTMPPGEHLFMFVIDGSRWVTPPLAEDFVDDGFGSRNGVVIVRPTEN